jgi:hypothetical protein
VSVLASTIGLLFVTETTAYESGFPGIFLHEMALVSGAGQMDGQAQVAASGGFRLTTAAQMDGHAQVSGLSILTSAGAAQMDGQAQMLAGSSERAVGTTSMDGQALVLASSSNTAVGAAQMDGRTSMVVAQSVPGAGLAEIDGAGSLDAVAPSIYRVNIFEVLTSGETITSLYSVILHNTINLTSATSIKMNFTIIIREITITLTASQAVHSHYHYVLTTPISVRPTLAPDWAAVLRLVQNFVISQTTSQKFIWGRILREAFNISATVTAAGLFKEALAQLFKLSDIGGLSHRIAVALSQNIQLSLSLIGGFSLKLLQKFLVATSSSPIFHYHLTLAGQVVVKDILGHFASAIMTQLFTVHPALTRQFVADSSLAQLLTVHPAFTNKLILQIVGNLQLSPSQLVKMLYKGDALLDGVTITALYISPSGTTTTWAVNTRTNAVTEYLNYDFQSFALMGNRYIAAGDGGLYELDGDTDDGALIISEMMSGYLQLNEKKLFGIKGAYVAIRGGGRFYLKLISGDGREYVYELKAQPNLMTTKVRIGKGISTTYMAFDLVTEGQDFDLDSLEFIPMTRGRRV